MESLPLASCPKHIPDGVGDCPLGGSGPAAFRAYSLPWLGQVFLEFPPQWPRHPEVVHFRRCGSLSHKAHLLSRMVMVAIPFSERCVFVQGSQGSSRIESKCGWFPPPARHGEQPRAALLRCPDPTRNRSPQSCHQPPGRWLSLRKSVPYLSGLCPGNRRGGYRETHNG